MKLSLIFSYLTAAVFGLYGLAYAIQPYEMALLTTGLKPDTTSGLIDLRATYGGMMIAVAALIIALEKSAGLRYSLMTIWLVLFSMAITRLLGFFIDGPANSLMYIYFLAEIIGGGLALSLQRRETP